MKSAFETYPLIIFGMSFVLLGFSMVEITMKYNNARIYQETIVSLIERHNRYDSNIDELIKSSNQKCKYCTYTIENIGDRYIIYVNFEIAIPVIKLTKTARIKSLTQSIV